MKWDHSVGPGDGTVVMWIKNLLHRGGRRLDLHKMVAADKPDCFHTHPAFAIRVVLWNGYVEELADGTKKRWRPGMIGLVRPSLTHRIAELPNGTNYSLWLRGRVHYPILLVGKGWPDDLRHTTRAVQDENLP